MRTVYLDYNATTPLDEGVKEAMLPFFGEVYGNPSSVHHVGQRARAALDESRERVSSVFSCKPSEIIFTSGATESCNHAIIGGAFLRQEKGRHIVTSQIEHHAVLHACEYLEKNHGFEISFVPPDVQGLVSKDAIIDAVRADTILVSLMAANNEVGTIQPVSDVGEFCSEKGILFHSDAAQFFGKLHFSKISDFSADLISLCPHKFYGPKGAGLLFVKSPLILPPLIHGGSHESERRAGTENLCSIVGLSVAVEKFLLNPVFSSPVISSFASQLISLCNSIEGVSFRGHPENRLSNTVAFSVAVADSISLLSGLDLEGFCASSGSACSSGSVSPSHVLSSMGVPDNEANSLIRFSLGRETSSFDIESLIISLPNIINRVRLSP